HNLRLVRDVGDDLADRVEREKLNARAVVERIGSTGETHSDFEPPRGARVAIRVRIPQRGAIRAERNVVDRPRVDGNGAQRAADVEGLRDGGRNLAPHRLDIPIEM